MIRSAALCISVGTRSLIILWEVTNWRQSVSQEKDLGFCITDNLKPSMQYVYSKASRDLGLIGRTISFKSTEYTFWFDYTRLLFVPIWNTVCLLGHHIMLKTVNDLEQPIKNVKDRTLLQGVQHRFTRMVPGLKMCLIRKRLEHLGLWTLEERTCGSAGRFSKCTRDSRQYPLNGCLQILIL